MNTTGRWRKVALSLVLATPPVGVYAQQPTETEASAIVDLPKPIVTGHRGTFNGKRMEYLATVEPVPVTGTEGKPTARIAAISYVARQADARRPVLFIFNGGPIVASFILHLGAFGPKRLDVPDDITISPESMKLVDNPHSLLDVADLVFFDPAGTGFSRLVPGIDPASQFGNVADSRQLASLIVEWRKLHGRETSPVYLIGESYGTMRAPEAAHQLTQSGTPVDGIVLLGQAVNIIEYSQRRGNIVSYAVSLPTLAATAWHHGKADRRGRRFDQFMADVRAFAGDDYIATLFQGASAPADRQAAVAKRLEEFTGLPARWYLEHQLRITKTEYQSALLPGMLLGTNDARYAGPAAAGDPFEPLVGAYARAFSSYLAKDLKAGGVGSYSFMGPRIGGLNSWDWGANKSPFGDWPYGSAISDMLEKNPQFRVLVGNGWTDTQTTVGAMEYLINQSGWPKERVRATAYAGGHMPYSIEASLVAITTDVRELVTRKW